MRSLWESPGEGSEERLPGVLRALHNLLTGETKEHLIWVGEREGMDPRTTLLPLGTSAPTTAPPSPVRDLIPVDNQNASLEQRAMTASSLPTVVTGAG